MNIFSSQSISNEPKNITQKSVPLFLLILAFTLLGCTGEKRDQGNANNLVPRFSFGAEGEVAIASAWQLATDEVNSIFIPDYMANRVYQFNLQGVYQDSYGNEGRGPGEFINPTYAATDRKGLYVEDIRLVRFDLDSDSTTIVTKNRAFSEFEVDAGLIYAFAPAHFLKPVAKHDEKLISVYNLKGEIVNSFGEYLAMDEDLPAGMSWPYIEVEDTVIHVAFQYFPFYRAYSTDGELLTDMDLSEFVPGIPNPKRNYETKSGEGSQQGITAAFRAMDAHRNRIFIARQAPQIVIDEFQFSGEDSLTYKTTYFYDDPHSERNYVQDFFYHQPSNSFYILEIGDIPVVNVYAIRP